MKQKLTLVLFLIAIFSAMFFVSPLSPYHPQGALALEPQAQGLKRVANFYFDVATGDVRGHSAVNKFGRNDEIDTADGIEDIWDGGGTWPEPTASQVYTFTSTSALDASDGIGARTMEIFGLDSAGALQNETISLTGTVAITAINSYSMIDRMIVRTAGISATNIGTITANANTDSTVTAQINAINNQTLMAIYKIPAGFDGCMVNYFVDVNKSGGATTSVDAYLYAKPTGEVWQIKQLNGAISGGTSRYNHFFGVPNCFEPLTLIKLSANVSANDTGVSGGYDLVLHPN